MLRTTHIRRAAIALATLTLACGDSTGPNANLSETQVAEMLQVMSLVAPFDEVPTGGTPARRALQASPSMAYATVSVSETADCPNGGSASVDGIVNSDEEAGTLDAEVTHDFGAPGEYDVTMRVKDIFGKDNGILILIVPRLLNYIVAIYLIIVGLAGLLPQLGLGHPPGY